MSVASCSDLGGAVCLLTFGGILGRALFSFFWRGVLSVSFWTDLEGDVFGAFEGGVYLIIHNRNSGVEVISGAPQDCF